MPVGRVDAFSSFSRPQIKAVFAGTKHETVTNDVSKEEKLFLGKFTKKQTIVGSAAALSVAAAIAGGIFIHKRVSTKNVLNEVQRLGREISAATEEASQLEGYSNRVFSEVCENFKNGATDGFNELKKGQKVIGKFELNENTKLPEKLIEYALDDNSTVKRTTIFKYVTGTNEIESYTIDEFAKNIQKRHVYDSTGRLEYLAENFKSLKNGEFSADTVYQPQIGTSALYRNFKGILNGDYNASKKFIMEINGDYTVHKGIVKSTPKETFELTFDEKNKARLEKYTIDPATKKERVYVFENKKLRKLEPEETEIGYDYEYFNNDDLAD